MITANKKMFQILNTDCSVEPEMYGRMTDSEINEKITELRDTFTIDSIERTDTTVTVTFHE